MEEEAEKEDCSEEACRALRQLLEWMCTSVIKKWAHPGDPYDIYVLSLRSKIHSAEKPFYDSCLSGYAILQKEWNKTNLGN